MGLIFHSEIMRSLEIVILMWGWGCQGWGNITTSFVLSKITDQKWKEFEHQAEGCQKAIRLI